MQIHYFEQRSRLWEQIRLGKFTASHAQAIAARDAGLETLCAEKAKEIITGRPAHGRLMNKDIARGIALEPLALAAYSQKTGNIVKKVGFCSVNNFIGCSPDGLIGEDGGVETKGKNDENHYALLVSGKIPSRDMWQVQCSLLYTARAWWDFVSFNPNFSLAERLIIIRVLPNYQAFEDLKDGLRIAIPRTKRLVKLWQPMWVGGFSSRAGCYAR